MMSNFKLLKNHTATGICLILLSLSTSVFAFNGHGYLSANVDASTLKITNINPQINYYNGFLNDAYPVRNNTATGSLFGLQGGYEWLGRGAYPAIALGLGIYSTQAEYGYSGQLIETARGDAASALYNYKFNIANTRLMAEAQFTWVIRHFTPFINVGVGPSWTQTNGYVEASVDSIGYPPLPAFQNRTNTQLSFQAGFGVGYAFNMTDTASAFQHERIALGYRYVGLGNASFGTRGILYPYKLNLGHLSSNDVYLSYTHLF
jgi:hypothetical protein